MIEAPDRAFLAALCLARAGLRVDPDKSYLIESRLAPVARREGFVSPKAFVGALRGRSDDRLVWAAVEAMAMSDTEFFRDPNVFDQLATDLLPDLARRRDGAPVRIWSLGCGTGQEVYSLAMLLADLPSPGSWELLGSDLSERNLEKAQAGLYSQFEVQRGLPARSLVRHFEKQGDGFVLSPRIRQMVRWRRVNILDDLAGFGRFDLVLCRNVLNGLAPEAQSRAHAALTEALAPGGRLIIGLRDSPGRSFKSLTPSLGVYAAA